MELLIGVITVSALVAVLIQGNRDELPSMADANVPPVDLSQGFGAFSPMELPGGGTFGCSDVSGMSVYRENIRALVQDSHPEDIDAGQVECDAILVAEPRNRHDPRAIAVVLGVGRDHVHHVGYISRSAQTAIHSLLQEARREKFDSLLCSARVSWKGDHKRATYEVSLDLDDEL